MERLAPDDFRARSNISRPLETADGVKSAGIAKTGDAGVSFFARVVASADGAGKWILSAEGPSRTLPPSHFTASGPVALKIGDRVLVMPEAGARGSVSYRVAGVAADSAAQALRDSLRSLGLSPDSATLALVAAARSFGLRVEPQRVKLLQALVEKAVKSGHADEKTAAAIATAADDKGFGITAETLSAIASDADPRDRGGRGDRRREDKRRGGTPIDAQAIRAAVADIQREGSGLSFFNAASGRSGKHWALFPLGFSGRAVEISATLRVLFNADLPEKSRRIEYSVLDICAPSRYWSIEFRGGSKTAAVFASPPLGAGENRCRSGLIDALCPLGFAVSFPEDDEGAPGRRFAELGGFELPSVSEEA